MPKRRVCCNLWAVERGEKKKIPNDKRNASNTLKRHESRRRAPNTRRWSFFDRPDTQHGVRSWTYSISVHLQNASYNKLGRQEVASFPEPAGNRHRNTRLVLVTTRGKKIRARAARPSRVLGVNEAMQDNGGQEVGGFNSLQPSALFRTEVALDFVISGEALDSCLEKDLRSLAGLYNVFNGVHLRNIRTIPVKEVGDPSKRSSSPNVSWTAPCATKTCSARSERCGSGSLTTPSTTSSCAGEDSDHDSRPRISLQGLVHAAPPSYVRKRESVDPGERRHPSPLWYVWLNRSVVVAPRFELRNVAVLCRRRRRGLHPCPFRLFVYSYSDITRASLLKLPSTSNTQNILSTCFVRSRRISNLNVRG